MHSFQETKESALFDTARLEHKSIHLDEVASLIVRRSLANHDWAKNPSFEETLMAGEGGNRLQPTVVLVMKMAYAHTHKHLNK